MFFRWVLSLLLFFSFSFAVTVTKDMVATDESITIKSKESLFQNETLYTHKKLLSCSPSMDAVFKYHSSKKLEILPRQPLLSSSKYRCTLDSSSVVKGTKEDLSFSFDTDAFALVDWNYRAKEKLLELSFNDSVELSQVNSAIKLYKVNNLAKTQLQYSIKSQDKRTLFLNITEATGEKLELDISPTLSTTSGLRLNEQITKEIDKYAHTEVKINDKTSDMTLEDKPVMIANEKGGFTIRLFFEDSFYGSSIRDFIRIDGIDNFQIKKDIYLNYSKRSELKLSNSYYAVDISSDEFQANSHYKLTIKKGLKHYAQLKEDKVYEFDTGDRKRGIIFGEDQPYLSNLGEIGFSSINISKATVIVEKITQDNYRYFINYHNGILKDAEKFSKEIFAKDISLDNPRNQIQRQKILLKDLITDESYGVYRVTIKYEDRNSKGEVINQSASKVIFVSDIGMSVNLSENQAFVSLLRLSDASPVANATVELYSHNNILLASVESDSDGIATIDKELLMSQKPKAIIVSTKSDKSFLLLDKSLNDISYSSLKEKQERFKAFVYFQSNIIRPAGSIHSLITIKDRDFISADKIPVKITLGMLYDDPFLEEVHTTDEFGLIDFTHTMDASDKTGSYQLKVWLGDKVIGKKTIKVEAFMPPKIENHIKTDKEIYKSDEYLNATISSSYLFGTPASNLSGKLEYSAVAYNYSHKKFKGYSFSNNSLSDNNQQLYLDITQDISLDKEGKREIILPCKVDQKVPSILQATLGATIMDDTQPVATYKEFFIYPYKKMVGIKSEQSSIESGQSYKASVVLIDPIAGKEIDDALSIVIKKRNWHYSYSNGHYNWESETEVVDSFMVDANREFERLFESNGDYSIEVHDRVGGHSASIDLTVSGWGYTNISPKANLKEVEINFEDRLYSRGESIKASFKSPIIEGRLLVTLEGDKVHWHKSIEIAKGTAQLDIPIDTDMGRGLYLHATAVRKTDTSSSIIPFRATGYKFIKPNRDAQRVKIGLEVASVTESKRTVPLSVTTDRDSVVLISVVDSGILNLIDQKPPKIFDYFNQTPTKKLLYFDLYEQVLHYLTEGNIVAFGAGLDNEKRKKHLAPENLDRVKPFMLWSKVIRTSDKQASYDIEVPEFNGKATIVAIALNKDSIGVASKELIVKDEIMIKPSYPRYLLLGDRVVVPIRIFNTTAQSQRVELTEKVSDNFSMRFDTQSIEVAANSSAVITATLEATKEGKGSIELSTELNGKVFSKSVALAVMTPYAMQTKSYQDTTSQRVAIDIPAKFNGAKALINLSDNLLGRIYKDLNYLVSYPYGCAEQTSSKIAAIFYAKPFMREDRLLKDSDHFIRQGIKRLSRQQNGYGEFAYWEPDGYVNSYASLYASEVLLDLDAGGHSIDTDVKKRIYKALKSIVLGKSSVSGKYDEPLRVYAAYILSTHGKLSQSSANMLYDKKLYKKYYISYYYMVAILKNMGQNQEANKLYSKLNMLKLEDIKKIQYDDTFRAFASRSRDMFLVFYLNSKHFNKNKADFEVVKAQLSHLYSTHEKALAFKALATYLGKAVNQKMRVAVVMNGDKKVYSESVAFSKNLVDNYLFIDPLSGVVNYSIELYKPLPYLIKNQLSNEKKLSIQREFVDANGYQVDLQNLEQGSKIYSKLTLSNYINIDNLVINQRVPACMEIVNTRISQSKNRAFKDVNLNLEYKDIRDDRVLYFLSVNKKSTREKIPGSNQTKLVVKQNKTIIYTPLIATTLGECKLPAVITEAMYDSRISDYAKESQEIVVKTKEQIAKAPTRAMATSDEVKSLVRDFYLLEASNAAPREFLEYFHFPIKKHFNKEGMGQYDLLENKDRYNKEWKRKSYDIKDIQILQEDSSTQRFKVRIVFAYTLDNGRKKLRGVSKHLLTLQERNGKLAIESIEVAK